MRIATDLSTLTPLRTLHPRETLYKIGTLGIANAEVTLEPDGASTGSLDIRNAWAGTIVLEGSTDGVNYIQRAMRPVIGGAWVAFTTTVGSWTFNCSGFIKVRARMTAYTSGGASVTLAAHNGIGENKPATTDLWVTNTAAAGAALTLTLPAPGAGMRQYLTFLSLVKFSAAALTAAAAPVLVTTTNMVGNPVFLLPADAALQGTVYPWHEDFAYPVGANAQNTALTIVMPATPNVIWRANAGYYIAP